MKKNLLIFPFLCLLVFMLAIFGFGQPEKKSLAKTAIGQGMAVVELFTSEGCSSCPPADEAVADLAKDFPSNVFVLGFHVDYWNYLGWKDVFSNPAYSKRQEAYATVFSLNSIYTPQVVVNGETQFTGSDKSHLYSTVETELHRQNPPLIELQAKASLHEIQVHYKTNADKSSVINIALVQLHATSVVKKGENKGMELHHRNVVRDFTSTGNSGGITSLHLPEGLAAKDCRVIAFVQNKISMHISAATDCAIQ